MADPSDAEPRGLDLFMGRVLEEGHYAIARMTQPGIKKVRTSLRRCRSVAEVLRLIDPDPAWNEMRLLARALFRELGPLRDIHVLREWVSTLMPKDDVVGTAYLRLLAHNERKERAKVREALERFDVARWAGLRSYLVPRAARHRAEDLALVQVATERLEEAWAIHRVCRQGNAPARTWHELRKTLKRFRYILEGFLPSTYGEIGKTLKKAQDALGELHDIDVLHDELMAIMPLFGSAPRKQWSSILRAERSARLERYHALTEDPEGPGLWSTWRAPFPQDDEAAEAALERLARFAADSAFGAPRGPRRAEAARALFEGLAGHPRIDPGDARTSRLLRLCAHLVDLDDRRSGRARRLLRLRPPWPWSEGDLEEAALVVKLAGERDHLPSDERLVPLTRPARERVTAAAALLRAVEQIDDAVGGPFDLRIEHTDASLVVQVSPREPPPEPTGPARVKRHAVRPLEKLLERTVEVDLRTPPAPASDDDERVDPDPRTAGARRGEPWVH